jgi:hypothetical protein
MAVEKNYTIGIDPGSPVYNLNAGRWYVYPTRTKVYTKGPYTESEAVSVMEAITPVESGAGYMITRAATAQRDGDGPRWMVHVTETRYSTAAEVVT